MGRPPGRVSLDRMKPWTRHVFTLLSDGRWHHMDDLIPALALAVPPAWALHAHELRYPGVRGTRMSKDVRIASGRRYEARRSFQSCIQNGRVERDGDRLRLSPSGLRAWQAVQDGPSGP